ncbi:DNA/RNA helicase [Lysinibacillus yapensis]|uniref:DNA/RNA helicase n=1 Tax=Ureibacillus yapensis TaxID=2304605 RepID=A0A396SE08_9BACL|nr:DEAD/DEAH box helicase family protein [Lysinibacillus yapensis]RHW39943.1 DNA/RNA helicase [Lysinibacillus yapensis]
MKFKLIRSNKRFLYKGIIVEPQVRDFFTGRIWTRSNTPFHQEKVNAYIQQNYFNVKSGITSQPKGIFLRQSFTCNRCYNQIQHEFVQYNCAKCEKICVYCRHCINMGRVTSCTNLILWNGPLPLKYQKHVLDWDGTYTPAQKQAAQELTESMNNKRSHLVHAVCGAGKTEILFPAVLHALNKGLRVCIATPRTDVVLELFPRFQKVFPNTNIHALYGNAPKQAGFSQLVLSTTHQLFRFENAFDVELVDEADAFPYTIDLALQQAVLKAKKEGAPIAFVTATPSTQILNTVKKENWSYSFIPKRYHNHPLPVPRFEALWSYEKGITRGKIPLKLIEWTEKRLSNREPFLIFFPTIQLMQKAIPLFQRMNEKILSVHAEDEHRKEKVIKLRNEEIPGLLTTTILERGITINNVQVAVVGAESKIFTSSALIQISGRVGRNVQFPEGDIVFFHHGITAEMDEARNEILRLNKEGFGS